VDGGELLLGLAEIAGQGGRGGAGIGQEQPGAADRAGRVGAVVAAEPAGGEGGCEPPSGGRPAAVRDSSPSRP